MIQEGVIFKIDTPANIVQQFQGHLYSFKSDNLFSLLQVMESCPLNCIYYPYGESCHIVFYEDISTALPAFQDFMQQNGQTILEITPIEPSVEDCFIEIVKKAE